MGCADFKGEFKLGNGHYCYPLTVTDHASRFLLLCEALESTREDTAITAFEQLFRERGLPTAIRSDNGVPFASPNALFNLSKLSVWWLPAYAKLFCDMVAEYVQQVFPVKRRSRQAKIHTAR